MNTATSSSLTLYSFNASLRRRSRRRPFNPNPHYSPSSSDPNTINLSIDLDSISRRASKTLARFLTSASDAYHDLRTSVRVESGNHVVFSCRRSSIRFVTDLMAFGLVVAVAFRVLGYLGFWRRIGFGEGRAVVRRDRSLGGREVVVGRIEPRKFRVSENPLNFEGVERRKMGFRRDLKEEQLPEWWPRKGSTAVGSVGSEELKREANQVVRAILDNRLSGKDFKEDDIIQPEMEMVASGLKKTLGVEQRKHLLGLFTEVCGSKYRRIAEEALGLISVSGYEGGDEGLNSERF